MRRRTILGGVALLAAPVILFRAVAERGGAEFAFAPIPGLPGWRRLYAGGVSAGAVDPFAGLRAPGDAPPPAPFPPGDLCAALFGNPPLDTLPLAAFSDYYCPWCRDLTVRLAAREDPGLHLAWHELPLLGEASLGAARAALAADLQGAYPAFQARLLRASFQPTDAYLTDLARSLGLDSARLLADAGGEAVARRLHTSARAAATLGIGATPALVVGRTLVLGAIPEDRLNALLALERAAGPPPC
jgi:predicted DsbA family dithiol-disulfide isomerase